MLHLPDIFAKTIVAGSRVSATAGVTRERKAIARSCRRRLIMMLGWREAESDRLDG
jgi:hypothetical protein